MDPRDAGPFLAFAERLAEAAAGETLPRFRRGVAVDNKAAADFDPVTDADREAERAQRALIRSAYPDHGIVGEEWGVTHPGATYRWVLDPVDGTRAFICGVPSWTTLIAMEQDAKPVLGLIDQPYTRERWSAGPGGATFTSPTGARIAKTSAVRALSEARLSTTDPRGSSMFDEAEAAAFARLGARSAVARFSLDAYAYGLLALGELDLVVEAGLAHHDVAALVPVVEGAGGVITDWEGGPFDVGRRIRTLAAATPDLHAAALEVLRDA